LEALAAHHRQLEAWAENCPENFENRAALVGAEIARLEDRDLDAMRLYEKAIRSARANGFIHNEALAYERGSAFYRARGFEQIAETYLRNARSCYLSWGADGKVQQLDDLYPQLAEKHPRTPGSTIEAPVEHLDLANIIKVSQAVSGEMVLPNLIDVLMHTAIEQAGAERGLLILPRGSELRVKAEATTGVNTIIVRLGDVLTSPDLLPESIAHSVARTQEATILDDASIQKTPFSADPYFLKHQTRSILCLPLVNQRKLAGVLYLENNLASRVFTTSRITVLKILASQAAISLENARLYRDLQESQSYLAQAQRLSTTGSFGWKPASGEIVWSEETYRIFALEPKTQPTLEFVFSRVHPEDRQRLQQLIDRVSREKTEFDVEHRLQMPDGSIKYLHHVVGRPSEDESGCLEFVGAVTDITGRKQAEHNLQNALAEIKELKDQLYEENVALREEIDKASMFEEVIGTSSALRVVLSRVSKVAPADSTVLITGETGTGKELIARAIHKRSKRSTGAFISVNCAALPRDLIASELFGHEKGAFTGATQQRLGRFELAQNGTIFLDEVGELPMETQVALLRVLQEQEFERVGGGKTLRTNVRVIAATNRDLEAAIVAGIFRRDLFYRLNVFPIEIPPLRDRKEDIPLLVEYFIDRFARKAGKSILAINKRTLDLLQSYPWPGNIRELQNVIERSVIVSDTENFSVDESWLSRRPTATKQNKEITPFKRLPSQEKAIIEDALRESGGRVSGPLGAAAKLGIPGSTLDSKIRSLKIDKNRFKGTDPTKNPS
jgi:transcriptional regulator with GAF, ATPase, and Fis domain